jgi:hypothetical protein
MGPNVDYVQVSHLWLFEPLQDALLTCFIVYPEYTL